MIILLSEGFKVLENNLANRLIYKLTVILLLPKTHCLSRAMMAL